MTENYYMQPIHHHHYHHNNDHQHNEPLNDTATDRKVVVKSRRLRGKAKIYMEYASFKDCQTADAALKQVFAEHKWRKRHLKDSKEGKKRFYDCNTMGPRAQCPVRLYILMHVDSSNTTVFISVDQHNHHEKFETDNELTKLPDYVKKEILHLYMNELKAPIVIWEDLKKKNYLITYSQLTAFLQRYKCEK